MYLLYSLLALMLLIALSLIAIPFIKNTEFKTKGFLTFVITTTLFSFILYSFSGNKPGLKLWLTQGKKHYQLENEVNQMGGIDGVIASIQKKLETNPDDVQGWTILGKLYLAKHDYASAEVVLKKAHQLAPDNQQINHYYELAKNKTTE
jgi:cytochrome c-type biogenesis protein CcmH/NrfG